MLVACLWSLWTASDEPELLSFAAIIDEPPAEVAEAGYDCCIVLIRPENMSQSPETQSDLRAMHAILADRERLYYEYHVAA
jgi:hypothetical protein